MDMTDRATEDEFAFLKGKIKEMKASMPSGEAATQCEECGEMIPEARRRAAPGCRYCISCQQELEQLAKLY